MLESGLLDVNIIVRVGATTIHSAWWTTPADRIKPIGWV